MASFDEESPDLTVVAHGLDGPHDENGRWRFDIDPGSALPACFAAMLWALAQSGCPAIRAG
jgi:hypothetical protein